jgi:hypothetical protein
MTQRIQQTRAALQSFNNTQRTALEGAYGFNMTAYKPANQVVAASTTFVNDDTMWAQLAHGAHYLVLTLSTPSMTAAGGLKLQFVADQGLTIRNIQLSAIFLLDATAPAVKSIAALASAVNGGTTSAWTAVQIVGSVFVENPGVLQLQWAQQAASGSTTVGLGSIWDSVQVTS